MPFGQVPSVRRGLLGSGTCRSVPSSPPTRPSTTRSPTRSPRSASPTGRGPRRSAPRPRPATARSRSTWDGQVHEPRRAGRLRRRVPGHRAVDGAGQPARWRPTRAAPPSGPIRYEVAGAAAVGPLRARRRTTSCRWPSSGPSRRSSRRPWRTGRCTGRPTAAGSTPTSSATTRPAWPAAGSRSTASGPRSSRPPGSRPATTPGACATWSARRSRTCRPGATCRAWRR